MSGRGGGIGAVPGILLAVVLVLASVTVTGGAALAGPTYRWSPADSPITGNYWSLSVLDAYSAWAGTGSGKVIHWNGSAWVEQATPAGTAGLAGMDALDARHVWAVDQAGHVLFFDGSSWALQYTDPAGKSLNAVAAVDSYNVWAVGNDGTVLHYNGNAWSHVAAGASEDLYSIAAFDGTHIWMGGGGSSMRYFDGVGFVPQAIPALNVVTGISALAPDDVWAVGLAGLAIHYDGGAWSSISTGLSGVLTDVLAAASDNVIAVGDNGSIFQFDGKDWSVENSGTTNDLQSVDRASGGLLCAVGYFSTILVGGPDKFPTWYLAEGSTAWGFSTYVTIENPNPFQVHADITYMTQAGPVDGGSVLLPSLSQVTVEPSNVVGYQDFSTHVKCREGLTLAVDRTMSWTGQGATRGEGHCSIGVAYPDTRWFLPEGSSAWGFECWLLIQNPNDYPATCAVIYMLEDGAPRTFEKTVPAGGRASFDMAADIGQTDASIEVLSDVPVIPERSMYRNQRREGHDSIGTTAPSTVSYLAEGCGGFGFTTYVLVQNPNDAPVDVDVTYMTGAGPVAVPTFQMDANSRRTINVNATAELPDPNFSTSVRGSGPIIAERAMYWGEGSDEACHDSIGLAAAHSNFYLPDGQTSEGRETWTLVQNPNGTDVVVEISYLMPGGQAAAAWEETIPADSRRTFNMADKGVDGRAAVMVKSRTAGRKVMVERSMYWDSRAAGTDTIGGFSD